MTTYTDPPDPGTIINPIIPPGPPPTPPTLPTNAVEHDDLPYLVMLCAGDMAPTRHVNFVVERAISMLAACQSVLKPAP